MSKIAKYFILTMLVGILGACQGNSVDETTPESQLSTRLASIQQAGQLVIGTAITRPFEYRDAQTNQLIGYDVELMTAIFADLNVQLVWRELAFADLLPELQAGNVDVVIAGMYITPARSEIVNMSIPYLQTGLVLVSRTDLPEITSMSDLNGRTLGVKEGSTGERYAARIIQEQALSPELRRYTDTIDSLNDLSGGLIDAVLNDYINTLEYIKTHPNVRTVGQILEPAGLGISTQLEDTELMAYINTRLEQFSTDGTLTRLYSEWIQPVGAP